MRAHYFFHAMIQCRNFLFAQQFVRLRYVISFVAKFLEVLNAYAPVKKKVVRANEVPYMTKALRKAIATRSRLENKYYKYKTDESRRAYKKHNFFCSRLYKKERRKYYTNLDLRKITDSKKIWRTTKPFFTDKGGGKSDIILIEEDKIISGNVEVAQLMSDFFSNAVNNLNISIPNEYKNEEMIIQDSIDTIISKYSEHPSIKLIKDNVAEGKFSFTFVNEGDIQKQINLLDGNKAAMTNSIPPKLLKEYSIACITPLTKIINIGISSALFDSTLKRADLIPVHKSGDTTNKGNYRNISLLPVVSKLFEKVIQTQISKYINKFLSPYLCGYRKGYSAQYALLIMLEKWKTYVDKGGYGGGVLMDLSKAFDTLDHELLIAKLHAYGFDKHALHFIKSYLSERWQRVKINTSYSSWSQLLSGVPQGSVLGPLLFNLFINDLFFTIKTDICNYADDTTLYTADMSLEELMVKLECGSKCAIEWFCFNGMKLNASKCHLLICGHKHESMILNIGGNQVIESNAVKLLGMQIESELTFSKYMETLCKKASQKMNALSRLCAIIPFSKRKLLMSAFFNSQFSYSPLVWMFHSRKINTKINNLHYRALRMVYRDSSASFDELLRRDGTIKIHHRNVQCLAIELYKVINNMGPIFMRDIFSENKNSSCDNVSSHTRSQAYFYNYSNPKTVNCGINTLRNLAPKIWESVPIEIRNSPHLAMFKLKIKNWVPYDCPCRICQLFIPQLGFF